MRNRRRFCLAALVVALFSRFGYAESSDFPPGSGTVEIEADRVFVVPGFLDATLEGHVRFDGKSFFGEAVSAALHLTDGTALFRDLHITLRDEGDATIEAKRAILEVRARRLRLGDFRLRSPAFSAFALSGREAVCDGRGCRLRQVHSPLCPHPDSGFKVDAGKLTLYPSGTVDMEDVRLSVHDTTLTRLPWIRLRPEGKAGFLAPRLGYTEEAGVIFGPAGLIPLDGDAFLEGSAAIRTRQGFETLTSLHSDAFQLKINQLYAYPKNLMRWRASAFASSPSLAVGGDIDWLSSDRRIIDESTQNYLDRAITHTSSRILLSHRTRLALAEASAELYQAIGDETEWAKRTPLSPVVSLSWSLPLLPMGGHFFVSAEAEWVHRGLPDDENGASSEAIPAHSRIALQAGLSHLRKAGPFSVGLDLKLRDQQWLPDDARLDTPNLLVFGGALSVSMPLFRDFGAVRHVISPEVRYRITPFIWGHTPTFAADSYDLLRSGHGVEFGFSTSLRGQQTSILRLDVYERIALSGFEMNRGPSYLSVRAAVGPPDFQASLDGAWDRRRNLLSVLGFSVHRASERGSVDVGFRRLGPGEGPHLDQPFSTAFSPWTAAPLFEDAEESTEAFQFGELPLKETLSLVGGIRGEIHPGLNLHALWYGLRLHSRCRCLSAAVTASHRVSNPVPDVFMTFEFDGS